jgi:hypothetical protein
MVEWRYSSTLLDLNPRWRRIVSFMLLPLYTRRKSLLYQFDRKLDGPSVGLNAVEIILLVLPEIELRPSLYRLVDTS